MEEQIDLVQLRWAQHEFREYLESQRLKYPSLPVAYVFDMFAAFIVECCVYSHYSPQKVAQVAQSFAQGIISAYTHCLKEQAPNN